MNRPHIGLVPPPPVTYGQPVRPASSAGALAAGLVLLALATGVSVAGTRALEGFLTDLDRKALGQAEQTFKAAVDQQRGNLRSQIGVLADDTRIRATVMTPQFDENTVRDVLNDLRKASSASVLAVLDADGRVKAVSGLDRLRGADVGSSPVIKSALNGPAVDLWTFSEQVLNIGVAPIRAGEQVPALLLMGFAVNDHLLDEIQRNTGVHGGVFVGDRMVLSGTTKDPAIAQALQQAAILGVGSEGSVGGGAFLARTMRTSDAAAAARMIWIVPRQQDGDRARLLRVMTWTPAGLMFLAVVVMLLVVRRNAQGGAQ